MRLPALALIGLACSVALAPACGRKKSRRGERSAPGDAMPGDAGAARRAPVPDRIEGTLTLDDAPLAIAACRPGRDPALYVDLVTAVGALRFVSGEAERMFWNPRPAANTRGEAIACSIPHRSWGGGNRADGAAYFRGELAFSCRGAPGAFEGKVSLDCGDIRPDERAGLDEQRHRLRDEQDRAGSGASAGAGSGSGPGAGAGSGASAGAGSGAGSQAP